MRKRNRTSATGGMIYEHAHLEFQKLVEVEAVAA
jgi:hypothetical protein